MKLDVASICLWFKRNVAKLYQKSVKHCQINLVLNSINPVTQQQANPTKNTTLNQTHVAVQHPNLDQYK